MVRASDSFITLVPRLCRMYLESWLISRWRLPATPDLTLPLAVILKRFFAPDFVFNFGISMRSSTPCPLKRVMGAAVACHGPGRSKEAARPKAKPAGKQRAAALQGPPPSSGGGGPCEAWWRG